MKTTRAIVDYAIDGESLLWQTFRKWLGDLPAEYMFLEKSYKGIFDQAIEFAEVVKKINDPLP